MSGNDVTTTELADGALIVQRLGLPDAVIYPEVATALREHFAAERMPEDVQTLVDDLRSFHQRMDLPNLWHIGVEAAIARIEAAYSQTGAEPEWEYRTLINGGDPHIHRPLTVGSISVAEWFSHDDPRTASGELTLERRRVAGPWEPVEKGADHAPR